MREEKIKLELIQRAREVKFVSQFFTNEPYKHSLKEDLRYLLWMEEFKDWFRVNHNIYIEPYRTTMKKFRADVVYDHKAEADNEDVINDRDSYEHEVHTYSEALEQGLLLAFKYL